MCLILGYIFVSTVSQKFNLSNIFLKNKPLRILCLSQTAGCWIFIYIILVFIGWLLYEPSVLNRGLPLSSTTVGPVLFFYLQRSASAQNSAALKLYESIVTSPLHTLRLQCCCFCVCVRPIWWNRMPTRTNSFPVERKTVLVMSHATSSFDRANIFARRPQQQLSSKWFTLNLPAFWSALRCWCECWETSSRSQMKALERELVPDDTNHKPVYWNRTLVYILAVCSRDRGTQQEISSAVGGRSEVTQLPWRLALLQ